MSNGASLEEGAGFLKFCRTFMGSGRFTDRNNNAVNILLVFITNGITILPTDRNILMVTRLLPLPLAEEEQSKSKRRNDSRAKV